MLGDSDKMVVNLHEISFLGCLEVPEKIVWWWRWVGVNGNFSIKIPLATMGVLAHGSAHA